MQWEAGEWQSQIIFLKDWPDWFVKGGLEETALDAGRLFTGCKMERIEQIWNRFWFLNQCDMVLSKIWEAARKDDSVFRLEKLGRLVRICWNEKAWAVPCLGKYWGKNWTIRSSILYISSLRSLLERPVEMLNDELYMSLESRGSGLEIEF